MAKQCGVIKLTGTIDEICFYKMNGVYYARSKSSLSGKRVKKDPAFRRTMEQASLLGRASKLAAKLKGGLTVQERKEIRHGKLTAQVRQLLIEGKTEAEVFALLRPVFAPVAAVPVAVQPGRQPQQHAFAEEAIRVAMADKEAGVQRAEQGEQVPAAVGAFATYITPLKFEKVSLEWFRTAPPSHKVIRDPPR